MPPPTGPWGGPCWTFLLPFEGKVSFLEEESPRNKGITGVKILKKSESYALTHRTGEYAKGPLRMPARTRRSLLEERTITRSLLLPARGISEGSLKG